MNIPDLTTQQDTAFVTLRKFYNRDNPSAQLTKAQLVELYANRVFNAAIDEADQKLTAIELQKSYKAATPTVQAQVNSLLGL